MGHKCAVWVSGRPWVGNTGHMGAPWLGTPSLSSTLSMAFLEEWTLRPLVAALLELGKRAERLTLHHHSLVNAGQQHWP
jgi:hypothetical protein